MSASKRKAWIIIHLNKQGNEIFSTKVFKKEKVYKSRNIKGTHEIIIKLGF